MTKKTNSAEYHIVMSGTITVRLGELPTAFPMALATSYPSHK